jgi:hypothetical protein
MEHCTSENHFLCLQINTEDGLFKLKHRAVTLNFLVVKDIIHMFIKRSLIIKTSIHLRKLSIKNEL